MDGDILWTPAPDAGETTKMGRFMAEVARRHGEPLATYDDFQSWSVEHLEDFYAEMAEFCGVRFTDPPREVLTTRAVPDATWFPSEGSCDKWTASYDVCMSNSHTVIPKLPT